MVVLPLEGSVATKMLPKRLMSEFTSGRISCLQGENTSRRLVQQKDSLSVTEEKNDHEAPPTATDPPNAFTHSDSMGATHSSSNMMYRKKLVKI